MSEKFSKACKTILLYWVLEVGHFTLRSVICPYLYDGFFLLDDLSTLSDLGSEMVPTTKLGRLFD